MALSDLERMSALMLAQSIHRTHQLLDIKGELGVYIYRLNRYQIFSIGEIADFAKLSEYKVRQAIPQESAVIARSGVHARHLDHLIRMVGDPKFAKIHLKTLLEDGAKINALSRITGIPLSTLNNWKR
jgi:hypothetical protein